MRGDFRVNEPGVTWENFVNNGRGSTLGAWIGGSMASKLIEANKINHHRWVRVGSLDMMVYSSWSSTHMIYNDTLKDKLNTAWYLMQMRKGNGDIDECPHCKDDLEIDSEGCCESCGADIETPDKPDTCIGLYKEIVAYEKKSGKTILERIEKQT